MKEERVEGGRVNILQAGLVSEKVSLCEYAVR